MLNSWRKIIATGTKNSSSFIWGFHRPFVRSPRSLGRRAWWKASFSLTTSQLLAVNREKEKRARWREKEKLTKSARETTRGSGRVSGGWRTVVLTEMKYRAPGQTIRGKHGMDCETPLERIVACSVRLECRGSSRTSSFLTTKYIPSSHQSYSFQFLEGGFWRNFWFIREGTGGKRMALNLGGEGREYGQIALTRVWRKWSCGNRDFLWHVCENLRHSSQSQHQTRL